MWAARISLGSLLALFWSLSLLALVGMIRILLGLSSPPASGLPFYAFETGLVVVVAVSLTGIVLHSRQRDREPVRRAEPRG